MTNRVSFLADTIKTLDDLRREAKKAGRSVLDQARAWAISGNASERGVAAQYMDMIDRAKPSGRVRKKKEKP